MNNDKHRSYGIVIDTHISRVNGVLLLDNYRGKIEGVLKTNGAAERLVRGTLVEFLGAHRNDRYFISYIEPIKRPESWVMSDIVFLHRVLELCKLYVPIHGGHDVFLLLMNLFRDDFVIGLSTRVVKKLILCRILALCGLYPEDVSTDAAIISLISSQDDSMLMENYHKDIESGLERWLYQALRANGVLKDLKTCFSSAFDRISDAQKL